MSRFVDISATHEVRLGECQCPGTPHADGDVATVRDRMSGVQVSAYSTADRHGIADVVAEVIVDWTMTDEKRKPIPVSALNVYLLDPYTMTTLADDLAEVYKASMAKATVPNGSGAPSRNTSRARARQTPTTRPRR